MRHPDPITWRQKQKHVTGLTEAVGAVKRCRCYCLLTGYRAVTMQVCPLSLSLPSCSHRAAANISLRIAPKATITSATSHRLRLPQTRAPQPPTSHPPPQLSPPRDTPLSPVSVLTAAVTSRAVSGASGHTRGQRLLCVSRRRRTHSLLLSGAPAAGRLRRSWPPVHRRRGTPQRRRQPTEAGEGRRVRNGGGGRPQRRRQEGLGAFRCSGTSGRGGAATNIVRVTSYSVDFDTTTDAFFKLRSIGFYDMP